MATHCRNARIGVVIIRLFQIVGGQVDISTGATLKFPYTLILVHI